MPVGTSRDSLLVSCSRDLSFLSATISAKTSNQRDDFWVKSSSQVNYTTGLGGLKSRSLFLYYHCWCCPSGHQRHTCR